jgi:hypothetical protein
LTKSYRPVVGRPEKRPYGGSRGPWGAAAAPWPPRPPPGATGRPQRRPLRPAAGSWRRSVAARADLAADDASLRGRRCVGGNTRVTRGAFLLLLIRLFPYLRRCAPYYVCVWLAACVIAHLTNGRNSCENIARARSDFAPGSNCVLFCFAIEQMGFVFALSQHTHSAQRSLFASWSVCVRARALHLCERWIGIHLTKRPTCFACRVYGLL